MHAHKIRTHAHKIRTHAHFVPRTFGAQHADTQHYVTFQQRKRSMLCRKPTNPYSFNFFIALVFLDCTREIGQIQLFS